jgi:predicted nucleic acid-binding protein
MIAVDTNIFVYAVDTENPAKGAAAVALLRELSDRDAVLLWQVLVEIGATLLRKKAKSDIDIAIPVVISAWMDIFPLRMPSAKVALDVWRLIDAYQLSYFDSLIISACIDAGVTRLYSEDMQSRGQIEGVEIINPFAS